MANPNQNRTQDQTQQQAPEVNPRWAEQMERATAAMTAIASSLPKFPVAQAVGGESDRTLWTTPEQAEKYDAMVGRDFIKIDPKTKEQVGDKMHLFRPTHIYPEFQTANANEFRAKLNVEEFYWEKQKDSQPTRTLVTTFQIYASAFEQNYRATAPEPAAVEAK